MHPDAMRRLFSRGCLLKPRKISRERFNDNINRRLSRKKAGKSCGLSFNEMMKEFK